MAVKTNAMRMLDRAKISYTVREFPLNGLEAAVDVPSFLGITRDRLFKTLVTTDTLGGFYVFVIPSSQELDLKKAAACARTKRIEMLKQKDLLKLTGYIHGGCSPVGMKKLFPTFLDSSAMNYETILVSGGKVGFLVELDPGALQPLVKAQVCSLTRQALSEGTED